MNLDTLIEAKRVGEEVIPVVDLRGLHKLLEVKRKFADWAKDKVKHYKEGEDFCILSFNNPSLDKNGKKHVSTSKEYYVSLEIAKSVVKDSPPLVEFLEEKCPSEAPEEASTLSARTLHKFLGVKTKFTDWIERKIASLDLEEREDYTIQEISTTRGRTVKDYILSEEAYILIKATSSTDILREVVHTNTKTKAILKDLEHVELQIPEGFTSRGGELYLSSLEIAKATGKRHDNILRDIKTEKMKLQPLTSNLRAVDKSFAEEILKGFSEETYIEPTGRLVPMFNLSEKAAAFVLLRYSYEFRVRFMRMFEQYRSALIKYLQVETVAKHIPQKSLSRRYIYIIENINTENFKVGVTTDIARRLATFQTGCDGELSVYYESLVCSNAKNIEAEIHNHFRKYKIREGAGREWFSNELDKLDVIDYLKEQNYVLESSFGEDRHPLEHIPHNTEASQWDAFFIYRSYYEFRYINRSKTCRRGSYSSRYLERFA